MMDYTGTGSRIHIRLAVPLDKHISIDP